MQRWLVRPGISNGLGSVSLHTAAARQEAVQKLLSNHDRVLRDIINPSVTTNIEGKPLTQLALTRLDPREHDSVDDYLRELAFRLLGERTGFRHLSLIHI